MLPIYFCTMLYIIMLNTNDFFRCYLYISVQHIQYFLSLPDLFWRGYRSKNSLKQFRVPNCRRPVLKSKYCVCRRFYFAIDILSLLSLHCAQLLRVPMNSKNSLITFFSSQDLYILYIMRKK